MSRLDAQPVWGKVHRGRVWHLLTDHYLASGEGPRGWCGHDEPIQEELVAVLPYGARACPRCVVAVQEFIRDVMACVEMTRGLASAQPALARAELVAVETVAAP